MKGWPNRRRLLWGRRSRMRGLAWPAVLLLVVVLATGIYFILPLFSTFQNHNPEVAAESSNQIHYVYHQNSTDQMETNAARTTWKNENEAGSYRDVLKIAAVQAALSAAINTSSKDGLATTNIDIENTGKDILRGVKIANNGKVVTFLPEIFPGEKKMLSIRGDLKKINITARDSSGSIVICSLHYANPKSSKIDLIRPTPFLGGGSSSSSEMCSKSAKERPTVESKSISQIEAHAAYTNSSKLLNAYENSHGNAAVNRSIVDAESYGSEPKFNLTIKTNQSEGRFGDIISFECTAMNCGTAGLSNLELVCAGKKTSTTYLTPGKEININGSFMIRDNALLNASVKGFDINGTMWRSNATAKVWMVSPELKLKAQALPEKAHRGEKISLSVQVENSGNSSLSNLSIFDSLGPIGQVPLLDAGRSTTLQWNILANESMMDEVTAKAYAVRGQEAYASTKLEIKVFSSGLNLTARPNEVTVSPGQPVDFTWMLNNTGEEDLENITLSGDGSRYKLNEIAANSQMLISAIYVVNETSTVNFTAKGYTGSGYPVQDSKSIFIEAVSPGINLKVTPGQTVSFAGDAVEIKCLVTNTGNDDLRNIILSQDGDALDRLEKLSPGEFQVFSPRIYPTSNSTIVFRADGKDSLGRSWSDTAVAQVTLMASAIEISANGPDSVDSGDNAKITCTIYNPGNVSLSNILVESKAFGPLGIVDYLAPKQQAVLTVDEQVSREIKDEIKAKGMTLTKQPVTDSCALHIFVSSSKSRQRIGALQSPRIEPKPLSLSQNEVGLSRKRSIQASYVGDKSNFMALGENQRSISQDVGSISKDISTISRNTSTSPGNASNGSINISSHISSGSSPVVSTPKSNDVSTNLSAPSAQINYSKLDASSVQNASVQSKVAAKSMVSTENASKAAKRTAAASEISVLIDYIKKMLAQMRSQTKEVSKQELLPSENGSSTKAAENYELAIESVKGSDHGRIKVLDVGAAPPHPSAGAPVKVTVHVSSEIGIDSASVKFGEKDTPITKIEMSTVDRTNTIPMILDSGDIKDGYWSCTIPGRAAGTYMVLSVALSDGISLVDDGPYLLHWSTVSQQKTSFGSSQTGSSASGEGMLFIESSVVKGTGEVSIKDAIADSAISYNERMNGNGSISLESLRCLDKDSPVVNFTQRRDLVFEGGQLQGVKSMESAAFHGGLGASISERFNLSHVDKSESDMIRSLNSSDNTLAFNTEQAFNGTWNIKTQYAQFFQKIKGDQKYSGSFQTEKKIKFQDAGKK
jgi:hypothetical protein